MPLRCNALGRAPNGNTSKELLTAYERFGGTKALGLPADRGFGVSTYREGEGILQDFDGGSRGAVTLVLRTKTGDVQLVDAPVRAAWLAAGGAASVGFPTAEATPTPRGPIQYFEQGCVQPDGSGRHEFVSICGEPENMQPLFDEVARRIPNITPAKDIAFAVTWLPTGKRWHFRGEEPRVAASTAKWIWAAAAIAANEPSVIEPFAIDTFAHSSNPAAGVLVDYAGGGDAINIFTTKVLGIPQDKLSFCSWNHGKKRSSSMCIDRMNGDNYLTSFAAVSFLESIWKRSTLGDEKRDRLLGWSRLAPETGFSIGRYLPIWVQRRLYQKRGALPPGCCTGGDDNNWINVMGIIPTARGWYAIVVSFAHVGDFNTAVSTLEWTSCAIWHGLSGDVKDPLDTPCGPILDE